MGDEMINGIKLKKLDDNIMKRNIQNAIKLANKLGIDATNLNKMVNLDDYTNYKKLMYDFMLLDDVFNSGEYIDNKINVNSIMISNKMMYIKPKKYKKIIETDVYKIVQQIADIDPIGDLN